MRASSWHEIYGSYSPYPANPHMYVHANVCVDICTQSVIRAHSSVRNIVHGKSPQSPSSGMVTMTDSSMSKDGDHTASSSSTKVPGDSYMSHAHPVAPWAGPAACSWAAPAAGSELGTLGCEPELLAARLLALALATLNRFAVL